MKREFIMFCGDMTKEEWYQKGGSPPKFEPSLDVEIRLATLDDLDMLRGVVSGKKLKKFIDWFHRGCDLFIAIYENKVIYYQWLAYSDFYDPWSGLTLKPADDEVIPIDIYTLPEFKFNDVHLAANYRTIVHCRNKGKYKMISLCKPEKFPLLKLLYQRTKFAEVTPLKHIAYRRFFGFLKRHTFNDVMPAGIE